LQIKVTSAVPFCSPQIKIVGMRTLKLRVFTLLILASFAGCKQRQTDEDAIRAAVRQHLASLGTLNLDAMNTDFNKVSVNNNQASADVSFRPKTGAAAGAAMQVTYQMEKQDGSWRVVKTSTPGGMIEHPNPNANPRGQAVPGDHGKLPNFQEMLGQGSSGGSTLPPGHPPVATQPQTQPPPQQQAAKKQPNQ